MSALLGNRMAQHVPQKFRKEYPHHKRRKVSCCLLVFCVVQCWGLLSVHYGSFGTRNIVFVSVNTIVAKGVIRKLMADVVVCRCVVLFVSTAPYRESVLLVLRIYSGTFFVNTV